MVNALLLMVNWLKYELSSSRVYAVNAPESFDPAAGVGYVVTMSAGSAHAEIPMTTARYQIRCIAPPFGYLAAHTADAAVFDVIHQRTMVQRDEGKVLNCLCELWGQDITDPDVEWAEVFSVYQAQLIGLLPDVIEVNDITVGSTVYVNGILV